MKIQALSAAFGKAISSNHQRTALIKKNILGSLAIKGVSVLINLLYVPLLIGYLDSERYGIWIVLSSIMTWFGFFDIGLGQGLRNKLTEAIVAKDDESARKLVSTGYFLMGIIFGSLTVLFLVIKNYVDWGLILNVKSISENELELLASVVFILMCLRFVVQLIQPILFALQKAALATLFPVLANLLGLILIYILTFTNLPKLLAATLILSALPVLTFIIGSVYLFSQKLNSIRPSWKYIDLSLSNDIYSLGAKYFFLQVSYVIINSTSVFIIMHHFGPVEVMQYEVAFKYYMVAFMLYEIILSPMWSAFTEALVLKDYMWAKKAIGRMNLLSFGLSVLVIIMLTMSEFAFEIWIGSQVSVPILLSLSLSVYIILRLFLAPYTRFINGSGKIQLSVYTNIFNSLAFIIGALWLVNTPLGVAGVVVSACFVRSVSLILNIIQTKHLLTGEAQGIFGK